MITLVAKQGNKGGLICDANGIHAFLPVSQLSPKNYPRVDGANATAIIEKLEPLIGKKFQARVITFLRNDKIIVSEREAMAEIREKELAELKPGDTVDGEINGVVKFGVFITFGNLEGLIHTSELSWDAIRNHYELFKIGAKVKAQVIGIDGDKISLSIKRLQKDPWEIYRDFALILIQRARILYEDDTEFVLEIENTVYAFDSTTIDLCMSIFPWAFFRKKKSGIKLHTQIDIRGSIPTFIHITEARENDVNALDEIDFEAGAIYVMDRAYVDTERLHDIHRSMAFFIVRWKKNIKLKRLYSHPVDKSTGVRCDQTVRFAGDLSSGGYPEKLRRIKYFDEETKITYIFLTNNFSLNAKLIGELYKERWKVELFFKWIKQHLEIKVFWGTSKNAIHTQVWIAVCTYVLVAIIKKTYRIDKSIYEILQILSVSLFDKTFLLSLFSNINHIHSSRDPQQPALELTF